MRENPQNNRPSASASTKFLFLETGHATEPSVEYAPFFFVEARVDFKDIRTGYRSMVSLSRAMELHPLSSDLSLVEDMFQSVDPRNVRTTIPGFACLGTLPEFVDTGFMSQMENLFIRYLLNSFKAKVYRNSELDVYSSAGESRPDFTVRCMDLLGSARRRDLDALHEVFNRRLGQIGQKYVNTGAAEDFDLAKSVSHGRDIFSDYLERIAELFLRSGSMPPPEAGSRRNPQSRLEMEERLLSLESEAQLAVARLWDSYEEKARSVDEYILHPNLKDIHIVRSCILWMPAAAA
ncbi:MAG: hypothetical protein H6Q07_205 [Acidobacteria bacterium]|nr:hypothetical protein [Acidobacteriota bacterium]